MNVNSGARGETVLPIYNQSTGNANRVVGHDVDTYAQQEDVNPGIGQRLKDALAQLAGLSGPQLADPE